MKSIIIVIVALLVLGGGGYYYMNMQTPATESEGEMAEEMDKMMENMEEKMGTEGDMIGGTETVPTEKVTVMYSKNGFEPASVTIKAGQMVEFMNHNDKEEAQIGFGEHLSHDEYPDKKTHPSLKMNEVDTITFPSAGTFEYHNHHNEDHEGTIIVE